MKVAHQYIAPIANISGRVELLNLAPNIRIEKWNYRKITQTLSKLHRIASDEIDFQLESNYCFHTAKRYAYVAISQLLLSEPVEGNVDSILHWHHQMNDFFEIIESRFSLIRLYIGGNARPLGHFCYTEVEGRLDLQSSVMLAHIDNDIPTEITRYCSENLNHFLVNTRLPFKPDYLQLAFDNLELSLQTDYIQLRFLCLMIALEAIFNLGTSEVTYRIARNAAILLGKDESSCQQIMSNIQALYKKRSILVHTGKVSELTNSDVLYAELYVRDSILALCNMRLSKEQLSQKFTTLAFGGWHA